MQNRQPVQAYDTEFYMKAVATFLIASVSVTLLYANRNRVINAGNSAATLFDYYFLNFRARLFKPADAKPATQLPKPVQYTVIKGTLADETGVAKIHEQPEVATVTAITLPTQPAADPVIVAHGAVVTTERQAEQSSDDDEDAEYVDALEAFNSGQQEDAVTPEPARRPSR